MKDTGPVVVWWKMSIRPTSQDPQQEKSVQMKMLIIHIYWKLQWTRLLYCCTLKLVILLPLIVPLHLSFPVHREASHHPPDLGCTLTVYRRRICSVAVGLSSTGCCLGCRGPSGGADVGCVVLFSPWQLSVLSSALSWSTGQGSSHTCVFRSQTSKSR